MQAGCSTRIESKVVDKASVRFIQRVNVKLSARSAPPPCPPARPRPRPLPRPQPLHPPTCPLPRPLPRTLSIPFAPIPRTAILQALPLPPLSRKPSSSPASSAYLSEVSPLVESSDVTWLRSFYSSSDEGRSSLSEVSSMKGRSSSLALKNEFRALSASIRNVHGLARYLRTPKNQDHSTVVQKTKGIF